ncbi:enoyl-CoA hydratase [Afipia sp. P52-10]|uniref:enoyl-CoA hydratase/isomerase family protein n=1 Tax=Afipia sp. P52-10 TaxID=1429916 RepID=UPI0003DF40CF|nr:enoyl-CoA hydratase/isomerase family protein [Afipia sp. P52-10]ETR75614.1 enoyl-CoA hydratase [Afipia sp. P52-10]
MNRWVSVTPAPTGDYAADSVRFSRFWLEGLACLDTAPPRLQRDASDKDAADALLRQARSTRQDFLRAHAAKLYRDLTDDLQTFRRVEELATLAAAKVPGLCPSPDYIAREAALPQAGKDGHEIDQGLFFHHVLADTDCGRHLCHAMLLPRREALDQLDLLKRHGHIDLGAAMVERRGKASFVTMNNSRYLNAEDDGTVAAVETAVDLALLDPATSVCVLRGGVIEHGKYAGQRVFSTGINLTHLYRGRISYLWYLIRDLGFVNKFYRGIARPEAIPDDVHGETIEKPWIAAVEKFAIGGGCQYLLTMDYTIAASDAYMTLPARKEGIVPGAANLRLPRFVGDRIARQAVMTGRRIDCDSPEGLLICDRIIAPDDMDGAIDGTVHALTTSGVVGIGSNRKAFRVAQEPLDLFRNYMAVYAREQAACHFSPALIDNLERFWNARERAA